jgi:hypothetical protein
MALSFTYLLDVANWQQYGQLNTQVDAKKLRPIILGVQQLRIEPLLGTALYNKLITDCPTYSGLYVTLMNDHITLLMIAYCDYEYTWYGSTNLTNKTVGQNSDEHIRANGTDQNNDYRDNLIKLAKQRERKLIGWLCDNFDDIPELAECDPLTLHQSIRPSKGENNYFDGIGII